MEFGILMLKAVATRLFYNEFKLRGLFDRQIAGIMFVSEQGFF
jgi:hypothetical protein